ncbi:YciI family protein [Nocardia stercoris]|uniref:YCII-related domain-containing protein n=1 Tax=Nocardia stercoris TaxID=2483361 RepID=A0A3M2L1W0_9NOCA|nr:YciI family protein [Nocardia stercoris]RMI28528.1 hypothetical protein EBN03_29335 [Nocardia stercoris]
MPIFAVHYTYAGTTVAGRDQHRPEHRQWLTGNLEQRALLSSGPYLDGSGALLLWRAEDADTLAEILTADPFAREGLIEAVRITEWLPIMGALAE